MSGLVTGARLITWGLNHVGAGARRASKGENAEETFGKPVVSVNSNPVVLAVWMAHGPGVVIQNGTPPHQNKPLAPGPDIGEAEAILLDGASEPEEPRQFRNRD